MKTTWCVVFQLANFFLFFFLGKFLIQNAWLSVEVFVTKESGKDSETKRKLHINPT